MKKKEKLLNNEQDVDDTKEYDEENDKNNNVNVEFVDKSKTNNYFVEKQTKKFERKYCSDSTTGHVIEVILRYSVGITCFFKKKIVFFFFERAGLMSKMKKEIENGMYIGADRD